MKSKTTALILSILVGGLGVDRFYLGYTGMGVLKLLTGGCFGVLWIIDIVNIATGKLLPKDGSSYEEDLEKKNRKYIQLQVSDIPKASLILERQFHVTDYAVQDEHNLRLYDTALDMAAINKALVVQDVAVISSQICNDTLEDYFKQITGGEGIA